MSDPGRNRTNTIVAVLVVLGLIAGLGIGLLIGWVLVPVKYVDTSLADLHPDYKEEYTLLVASAYAHDQDLDKARGRLEQLEVPNLQAWISPLIDKVIDEGHDETEIQALVALAELLEEEPVANRVHAVAGLRGPDRGRRGERRRGEHDGSDVESKHEGSEPPLPSVLPVARVPFKTGRARL